METELEQLKKKLTEIHKKYYIKLQKLNENRDKSEQKLKVSYKKAKDKLEREFNIARRPTNNRICKIQTKLYGVQSGDIISPETIDKQINACLNRRLKELIK